MPTLELRASVFGERDGLGTFFFTKIPSMPLSLASRATKYLDRTPLVAVDAASTAKVDHRRVAKLQSILRARHDSSSPSDAADVSLGGV